MTTDLTEGFEGGTSGAALSTTNTGFTAVGGVATLTNAEAHTGAQSMALSLTAQTGSGTKSFTARAVSYQRLYFKYTSVGAVTYLLQVNASATTRAQLRINVGGTLSMRNSNTTVVWTSTNTLSSGSWYRIEWLVDNTNSLQRCLFYLGDSVTAIEDSGSQTYNQGNLNQVICGPSAAATVVGWIDDFQSRDDQFPGPNQTVVSASTVAAVADVPASTASAGTGQNVTATAVDAIASVGAPVVAVSSNATALPSTVVAAAGVALPTLHTDQKITPSAVVAVAAVPSATLSGAGLASPSTVVAVAAVPSASPSGTAKVTPAVVQAVAAVGAPVVQAGAGAVVSSVVAVAAVGVSSVQTSQRVAPPSVSVIAAVPGPNVTTGQNAAPPSVVAVASVPSPIESVGSVVPVATVVATAGVGAVVVQTAAGATAAPATVQATAAVGLPTTTAAVKIVPPSVTATAGVGVPTITGTTLVIVPTSVVAVASIPTPSASGQQNVNVAAVRVAATTAVPVPTVTTSNTSVVFPATVGAVALLDKPTVVVPLAPVSPKANGSWYSLLAILQEAALLKLADEQSPLVDCPICGTALSSGPHGERYCPFDGWQAA